MEGREMARPKQAITLELAKKAEAEMKKIADHKVCFRLQAIISSAHHSVDTVPLLWKLAGQRYLIGSRDSDYMGLMG